MKALLFAALLASFGIVTPSVAADPPACCKRCSAKSKPCGDSCISKSKTCHKGKGCACGHDE